MNILFLSTWFPYPLDNGSRIRTFYLSQALATHHELTIVAFNPEARNSDNHVATQQRTGMRVVPVADDPFRYANLPTLVKYLSPIPVTLWPSRAMEKTVERLISNSRWDAFVAFQSPVARYARRVAAPVHIFDLDAALSHTMYQHFKAQTSPPARIRAWLSWQKAQQREASLVKGFDICTIASTHELNHLQHLIGSTGAKAVVIPNGVDCAHNHPNHRPKIPGRLVFNGSLAYQANHDAMRFFLSQIYPIMQATSHELTVTITGSTKGVTLASLALDNSVHLTGFVDDVRIPVAEAEVCVVPLRQGGGTRLKILEAMALGTPVVATSKGAEGLEVAPGKHLLVADDPATFARYTLDLLADPALRDRLAINARRLVEERYDWQIIGRRFVDLVEGAVERSRKEQR
ncbi:MAG: glycosyltransferase [Anaerolineae bacterium]|nr:glycosyltransferase [Anaerolineae bacterium]